MANAKVDLIDRASRIELLLLDVDGVLTDGSIVYASDGSEIKRFHVRDGSGLKFWHVAGKRSAIISGRTSVAVDRRAQELGIATVLQGRADKLQALDSVLSVTGLQPDRVCAIGDDLPDLPVLLKVGLSVAVADACQEVRESADQITTAAGGHGAVRETIEWLMKLQGIWDGVVKSYRV
jgi:3-deoxy-D-manno-octulosonate 8-phosphate phosphatase (KDO 8-P phosphatase)